MPVERHVLERGLECGTIACADALAKMLVCWVVGKPAELVLYCLRELRVLHDRVLGGLRRELLIKVRHVEG